MDVSQLMQAASSIVAANAVRQVAASIHGTSISTPGANNASVANLLAAAGLSGGNTAAASAPASTAVSQLSATGPSQLERLLGAPVTAGSAVANPLLQSPLLASALVEAQAAQAAQQLKAAETLQRLQNLQNLQNIQQMLAEQERKRDQLKQQTAALQAQAAQIMATAVAAGAPSPVAKAAAANAAAASSLAASAEASGQSTVVEAPGARLSEAYSHAANIHPSDEAKAAVKKKALDDRQNAIAKAAEAERLKCHLHKKPKDGCRFCKKHQEFVSATVPSKHEPRKASCDLVVMPQDFGSSSDAGVISGPLEITNRKTFNFPSVVQTHILDSRYYETTLVSMQSFEELVEEARKYAKNVEPYMPDSTTMPSPFFCLVYRMFTLGLDARQLKKLIELTDAPCVRCVGFVYIRFGLHIDKLWNWLGDHVIDDEEFQPSGSGAWTTIGDFVEALLIKEKYYTTLLPRISGGVRRQLEEKLAPVPQYRKRTRANREIFDLFEQTGTRVEAFIDGEWHEGVTTDVEDHPSRPKVLVRVDGGDGADVAVDLGKVVLVDDVSTRRGKPPNQGSTSSSGRHRSRSRSKDWSRYKGKRADELVKELREDARDRAVCATGKDYGRRPTTFDKGLAQPREGQGVAARRLLEEETFVKTSDKRRERDDSPPRSEARNSEPSAEHQERMRKLFEKYGTVRSKESKSEASINSIEGPDIMRLG
eukprot:TRINITY_DN54662_c0_g1_i1.p1 TRINITY_DN54662_c0_g1~~TRINITY_DN54662_c0_g1_i1.p1  ORF type:complete len:709 (-),score=150.41 TRINITY_DN54662_c0_g1_i1:175-2301(-)